METREFLDPYTLIQSDACFPLGEDTIRLAAFATVRRGWRVCDLGCGPGPLPLLLLGREPSLAVTGVERDPEAASLARRNLEENGLLGEILTGDLRDRTLLPAGAFDLAVSNPPWFPVGTGKSGGPARAEEACTLEELCVAAARLVKNGGRFALVHRPERLVDLLCALRAHGLEPKRLRLERPRVLVEAVRRGRPGLEIV